jgi:YesN/AraC family two-component response regulator
MIKVLIVEDEEHYGEFLKKIIERKYPCDRAKDGNEAKALITKNSYDIIIHDLRLPGIFGRDLIKFVRSKVDPDIVNIVVTGYEEDWPAHEATEEHIFFYLRKGKFKPEELMKVMDNAVQLRDLKLKERAYMQNLIAAEKLSSTGKLAIGIAHEINNPLQSMMAIAEVIKKKLLSVKSWEALSGDFEILEKGISRIKRVIKQLIDLHRIDLNIHGKNRLETIIERVVSFIRPIAKEKNTKIVWQNTVQNGNIYVEESQFFHILLNICLSLMDSNNETIDIETKKLQDSVEIQIKTRKKQHDEEWREEHAHIDSLSLEISRGIVNHLGGKIKYNDTEKGELIAIQLPYSVIGVNEQKAPLGR